eukprot:1394786-Amorphochlora_amoeboformis.AAC.1
MDANSYLDTNVLSFIKSQGSAAMNSTSSSAQHNLSALAFVSRGRNGPEQVEFLTRSGRSRSSGKTQTEKKNTRSEGDLKTKFSDGKQGDGKHADGEGVLKVCD